MRNQTKSGILLVLIFIVLETISLTSGFDTEYSIYILVIVWASLIITDIKKIIKPYS